jgi:hypothetical protein
MTVKELAGILCKANYAFEVHGERKDAEFASLVSYERERVE